MKEGWRKGFVGKRKGWKVRPGEIFGNVCVPEGEHVGWGERGQGKRGK